METISVDKSFTVDQLIGSSRKQRICLYRQLLWIKMREFKYTLQEIGDRFNRNHATILQGIRHAENLLHIRDKEAIEMWSKMQMNNELE